MKCIRQTSYKGFGEGCIHIINNIKFNKQSFREKKKCTNEHLRGEESSA